MVESKNKPQITLWALLSVFILFIFGGLTPLLSEQAPQIVFREDTWDFGKVKEGQVLSHTFIFSNEGNSHLRIKKVDTSCGCTAALASKQEIPPGKSGEIKVKFHTKGYAGKVSRYIFVESNDPRNFRKRLVVTAQIEVPPRPQIKIEDYSQDLGLVLEGEKLSTQISIKNTGERELEVEFSHQNASFFHEGKKINPPLRIASGKEVQVTINIPPPSEKGLLREYILVKSNDPRRPNVSIYVSGYIVTKEQLRELFEKYRKYIK